MDHGRVSKSIARGLRFLRKKIEAAEIPASALDESVNIATWNIRDFGKKRRSKAAIHYIAEIIGQFDLVALTEVRANLTDLTRVIDILGPYWKVVFSDWNPDPGGNKERVAYVYDKRMIAFTGLAAEADAPRKKNKKSGEWETLYDWWRSPYIASFRAGTFDFMVITTHMRWGNSTEERRLALERLAEWVHKRQTHKHVYDRDIILMGDFNIPKVGDPLFKAMTSKGLQLPPGLLRDDLETNVSGTARYDQILYNSKYTKTKPAVGGVIDFSINSFRKYFPTAEYPDLTKAKSTYQLSDHLPLWVSIDTWIADEQLDQILNR